MVRFLFFTETDIKGNWAEIVIRATDRQERTVRHIIRTIALDIRIYW